MRVPDVQLPSVAIVALAAGLSCTSGTEAGPEIVGPAAQLLVAGGNGQQGVVGAELLEPLVVRVLDSKGKSVSGQVVNFRVLAGGGSVFAGVAVTNKDGEARERWTLGTLVAETQTLEARAVDAESGAPLTFATFDAVALAGPPAQMAFTTQPSSTAPGAAISPAVELSVSDQYGNLVQNAVQVSLTLDGGDPAAVLAGTSTSLTEDGYATFGNLAIDRGAANYKLVASTTGVPSVSSTPFDVIAIARVDVRPISFGILEGDTVTLVATAYDAHDNPIAGGAVAWTQTTPVASISSTGLLTGLMAGWAALTATIGGVTGPSGGGVSVHATVDSLLFAYVSNGEPRGWTENTMTVSLTKCVRPFSFGVPGITNPLRWTPGSSDPTIIEVIIRSDQPQTHCFKALRPGSVTVTGSFGGAIATKAVTVH